MTQLGLRVTLAYLAFAAAVPGLLATISPSAFYDSFPFGRGWVQMLPPYNEHLIHDVGNYKLAFAVLFAWAAWRPSRELVVPVASAWSVAALLHAGYHALNLDGFGAADAIALIAVLISVLALPVLAIVLTRRERDPSCAVATDEFPPARRSIGHKAPLLASPVHPPEGATSDAVLLDRAPRLG